MTLIKNKVENNTILEVKDLSVAFGGRTVVENISYRLERGKTLGIVGESGSGKSVSSLALMGLLPKQASVKGQAWLSGETHSSVSAIGGATSPNLGEEQKTELLTLSEEQMREIRGRRISMIFQEPMTSLNPVQKCGEQVLEMMRAHQKTRSDQSTPNTPREEVIELFKEVLLPRPEKIFDSYPHELSGGQKQRVMIAMALSQHAVGHSAHTVP